VTMELVDAAVKYAWAFLGTPYRWGGDDPMDGFDCSGFVIEILTAIGKLPRGYDTTAAGLFRRFPRAGMGRPGNLVFWHAASDKQRIVHVEFCLDNMLAIGASGGGSKTTTIEAAIRSNAFIKIRPIRSREHVAGFVDPFAAKLW